MNPLDTAWKRLARGARYTSPAFETPPFGFENAVIADLKRTPAEDRFQWVAPLLKRGLACAALVSCLCVAWHYALTPEPPPNEIAIADRALLSFNP